jgi:hypothetical protein
MKTVHIVCRDFDTEKILPRKARFLADYFGCTAGDRPSPNAHINYYFCYIEYSEKFADWRDKTKTMAYFTHYEVGTPFKEMFWKIADRDVGLRLCSSDKYLAILGSPRAKVRPPVDPIFKIMERTKSDTPVVGVSGFVDPRSRRKGEQVLASVTGFFKAKWIGTGGGWPFETREHRISELPAWYNSLDLFVCSSLMEGVPMPPLEALACGIPVVIPKDLGIMDELPEIKGIYKYERGSIPGLRTAIGQALEEINMVDRQALRNAVREYTPENWAKDHQQAVNSHWKAVHLVEETRTPTMASVEKKSRKPTTFPKENKRGVFYVAFGKQARDCAIAAIDSFKRYFPEIPVALASDSPLGIEDYFIQRPDVDIGARLAKVMMFDLTPASWSHVVYLDADTEIIARNELLWQVVEDGWDMAICKNPTRFHVATNMRRPDNQGDCDETFRITGTDNIIQWNGGVLSFQRNERTKMFFDTWVVEWNRYGKRDQSALIRAMWACPLKLYVLGNEWNTVTRYDSADRAAWLLHYPTTARRWEGVVHPRSDSPEAWQAVKKFAEKHR